MLGLHILSPGAASSQLLSFVYEGVGVRRTREWMLGDSQTDALGGGRSEQTWAHVTVGEGEHFYLLAYAQ